MVRKQPVRGAKDRVKVTFILPGDHDYGKASVVGDFNNWDPMANPFKKRSNGTYSASVELPKDERYHYRYLGENDRWINEPDAEAHEPGSHGQQNCVLTT
ncbi:MAG: isoamylase early set domain-containing protein [Rhodothermales bacterium]|nr:isoamylase early set domain-containing protein [Rhodothermales bacterium]